MSHGINHRLTLWLGSPIVCTWKIGSYNKSVRRVFIHVTSLLKIEHVVMWVEIEVKVVCFGHTHIARECLCMDGIIESDRKRSISGE